MLSKMIKTAFTFLVVVLVFDTYALDTHIKKHGIVHYKFNVKKMLKNDIRRVIRRRIKSKKS